MSSKAEVRFSRDGGFFLHSTDDPTGYVRHLFAQYGEAMGDLEVRRATLEDAETHRGMRI